MKAVIEVHQEVGPLVGNIRQRAASMTEAETSEPESEETKSNSLKISDVTFIERMSQTLTAKEIFAKKS
eukprot:3560584-Pyramimonas_sp.AAC.1